MSTLLSITGALTPHAHVDIYKQRSKLRCLHLQLALNLGDACASLNDHCFLEFRGLGSSYEQYL